MAYETKDAVRKRVQEHFDLAAARGYKVIAVFLGGSQNYGLDYEGSDVDTKAIVIPSFEDIARARSPQSTTLIHKNEEHTDIKDVRLMLNCYAKQNIQYIETLYTDYYKFDEQYSDYFYRLRFKRDRIAHAKPLAAISCMYGMALEKYHALEHPYPAKLAILEKLGYDPKQLHHLVRLKFFMEDYINGVPYEECLHSKNLDYLRELKCGKNGVYMPLEEARELAKTTFMEVQLLREYVNENQDTFGKIDEEILEYIQKISVDILREALKTELCSNYC